MAFKKEKVADYFLLDTNVENIFINEYMVPAPGDYVKVYLLALMYAGLGEDFTSEDIAKQLGMEFEDVLKAWTYWEKIGIIKKIKNRPGSKLEYDVEIIALKEQLYGSKPDISSAAAFEEDLNTAMGDEQIKKMLEDIQSSTGRVMSSREMSEIISWHDDFGAAPEVIAYGFKYSSARKKDSIKYVEAVVKNWTSEGMKTAADVEKMLAGKDKKQHLYKRVFDALGFRRNATEEEKRIMDTWFENMGFPIETVLRACGKTAGISSPNINYVNKVLQNWYEEGERRDKPQGMPSTSEIMNYYELLRKKEEAEAEKRRKEVLTKVPEIEQIEEKTVALSSEISKIIISDRADKKEAADSIKNQLDALNAKRAFLLTDNNFEPDYMDVRYSCNKCRDTGILETGERCQCFGEITKEKIKLLKAGS